MFRNYFYALHLLALAGDRLGGVERAQSSVGLLERVGVRSRRAAVAAQSAAAHGLVGADGGARARRLWMPLVREPLRRSASVALQLCFDPVDRVPIARGALTPVAELREPLDRRLVALEVETTDEACDDRIGWVGEDQLLCTERHRGEQRQCAREDDGRQSGR